MHILILIGALLMADENVAANTEPARLAVVQSLSGSVDLTNEEYERMKPVLPMDPVYSISNSIKPYKCDLCDTDKTGMWHVFTAGNDEIRVHNECYIKAIMWGIRQYKETLPKPMPTLSEYQKANPPKGCPPMQFKSGIACDKCGTEMDLSAFGIQQGWTSITPIECPKCGFKGSLAQ